MRRVLFIADQFSGSHRSDGERHPGGAELTDAVAIAACPWDIDTALSAQFEPHRLERYDLVVVANFTGATREQILALVRHGRYVLFEHDVRCCVWRGNFPGSPEPIHRFAQRCWCPHPELTSLFRAALGVVYLTERQRRVYHANPFFRAEADAEAVLGCSLFEESVFARASAARRRPVSRSGACILHSPNAIKGTEIARRYCERHGELPRALRDLAPDEVLEAFRAAERFVYLPLGLEPAGRMPVEARLFGCEVVVNHHVGVSGEAWWREGASGADRFLRDAPEQFWKFTEHFNARPERRRPERAARSTRAAQWLLGASTRLGPAWPQRRLERRALNAESFRPW
jgi:hypothetical protein